MPAVSSKTVISFGLVAIPVALYTATQDNDIHFNQLHKEDGQRVKYKKTCSHCGKEVTSNDIIKGYQVDSDHYVTVSEEELDAIKTEKEKSIQILHFANLNQISPIYYDKSYHVVPQAGGDKAFELLRQALMQEQKIAIGKTVMGTHETLMSIIPREDGILISTMHFEDEVRAIPKSYEKPAISEQELGMAVTLINSMDTPFDPASYKDEYQIKLRELIESKLNGNQIVAAKAQEETGNIIDLMEALEKSIKSNSKAPKRTRAKTKGA